MDFLKRAKELKNEIIESRRYFHQTAEVGLAHCAVRWLEEAFIIFGK